MSCCKYCGQISVAKEIEKQKKKLFLPDQPRPEHPRNLPKTPPILRLQTFWRVNSSLGRSSGPRNEGALQLRSKCDHRNMFVANDFRGCCKWTALWSSTFSEHFSQLGSLTKVSPLVANCVPRSELFLRH